MRWHECATADRSILIYRAEDIILGPPKLAFASASRMPGKSSIDATDRSSRIPESDEARSTDRFSFREKLLKERDGADNDADGREARAGPLNARRGERDDWNNGRPRRTFGSGEQQDRRTKRNGDSERWEPRDRDWDRDSRDLSIHERPVKDKDSRYPPRRDGPPRSRHEGSWFRDDDGNNPDAGDADLERPSARSKEWRRDRVGGDRDWHRGSKIEQDPEWLDSTDREEGRRVRTQEDFERWKERMKAGAGASQASAEEKKEVTVEEPVATAAKLEHQPRESDIFSGQAPHNGSMERFFGLLGDVKQPQDPILPVVESTPRTEALPTKGVKSSRFAGLFSPPPERTPRETQSPPAQKPQPRPEHDPDQEGFQRILQMLGTSSKSRNATPQADPSQQHRPPPVGPTEQVKNVAPVSSPPRNRQEYADYHETAGRTAAPVTSVQLPTQNAPKDPIAQEREHLLRLMQQVRVTPSAGTGHPGHAQPDHVGLPPGILHVPEGVSRLPPGLSPQRTQSFPDDPAIAEMQRPDGMLGEQNRRRPATNGPSVGYFDDAPFPQANHGPMSPGGSRMPMGQSHPQMGLQRPPGFEHMPPPGWSGHQLPPQVGGGPSPMGPPPGIPTPTRGINPNFSKPPMPGNMPPLNERQNFARGAAGNGSAGFGPPPGMMHPLGYMNMNAPPPPGFPPMPPHGDGIMGLGHGAPGSFGGGNPGPQGPPPTSRHLLEMFGQPHAGDARGGMIGPGQYR